MSSDLRVGWAVRRPNNCDDNEDGHNTWGKWYTCCPLEMQKFVDADNNAGCTVGGEPREVPKQCAGNSTLVLWSDPYGYFCCDPDRIGFANENHYKGCATTDEYNAGLRNESMTKVFREGTSSATSSVSSQTQTQTPTSTTSSEPSSTSAESSGSSGSNTDKGAIAGGVVGGFFGALLIVGIIWFLLRCRRRRLPPTASSPEHILTSSAPSAFYSDVNDSTPLGAQKSPPVELHAQPTREELQGDTPLHELPENNRLRPN